MGGVYVPSVWVLMLLSEKDGTVSSMCDVCRPVYFLLMYHNWKIITWSRAAMHFNGYAFFVFTVTRLVTLSVPNLHLNPDLTVSRRYFIAFLLHPSSTLPCTLHISEENHSSPHSGCPPLPSLHLSKPNVLKAVCFGHTLINAYHKSPLVGSTEKHSSRKNTAVFF